ncbi:MAG: hypothetical protein IKZ95_06645 [Lachnospiraceae bacterium]|nr:hypothetical protein [Lachnospiraceae bacterium]
MDFYDETTNAIEWIDLETWERKQLFQNYLGTDLPYIIITANVDVTRPLAFAHENGISFNLVMVYLCNKTADSILNYRYRFIDGKPFVINHTRPTVNHLQKGSDIFVIGEGPWPCDDIVSFCKACHENMEQVTQEYRKERIDHKLDIINYTSVPWIQYTGFVRTIAHDGVDNAPKISFGKYFVAPDDPNKILMPVSSQTHHGLMDGVHVGKFYTQLQEACDRL